ncbi:MAG: TRAP transporter small permease subunit [Burkholderiales bacterium]
MLDRIADWIFRFGSIALLAAMIGLICIDTALRGLFSQGFIWGLDAVGLLLLCFFFILLPHSANDDLHVRMDVFYGKFAPVLRRSVDLIALFGAFVFAALIGWRALSGVPYMMETSVGSSTISIPHWPFSILIGLCCALFCILVARDFLRRAIRSAAIERPDNG